MDETQKLALLYIMASQDIIAAWQEGAWVFNEPMEGWLAREPAANVLLVYKQGDRG